MSRQLTDKEASEHNRVYTQGWSLIKGDLLLDGDTARRPGWFARRRLRRAIMCFEAALRIAPDSWQSIWALGKIHQRLGEISEALGCFARAHQIKPDQPDVAREAGIAATDSGDGPLAVRFSRAAIASAPNDAGLVSNLALALLINGEVMEAQSVASEAVSRAPSDPIARTVKAVIDDVAAGRRPQPKSERDLR